MTISAEALRELHRIHQQLADLKGQIGRGPRQVSAKEQAVRHSEMQLTDTKDAWKKTRMGSDEQQVLLKQREAKIEDLQRKLNECKDNKGYKILTSQIAAERQANSVLQDEILDKLDRIDQLQQQLSELEAESAKASEELEETRLRVDSRQTALASELERVTGELERAEAALPADFHQVYLRLIRAHGERGLAPVDGESCSGCYTILSPQTMNELYLAKPVFCNSCGCILYLSEDRSVGHAESS